MRQIDDDRDRDHDRDRNHTHAHEHVVLTFSVAQFVISLLVFILSAGIAWGTIRSEIEGNRQTLERIERAQKELSDSLVFIRNRQINNEGIIDQHSHEIDGLRGYSTIDRRPASDGPKK